jgi:hypothetical protein
MRKILIALAIIVTQFTIEAQIKTHSPLATINQVVGLTDVLFIQDHPQEAERFSVI